MATLNIPDNTYQRLAVKAASLNLSVEEMVAPALDQLAQPGHANGGAPSSSAEDRKRAFEEWTKRIESRVDRYPPGHVTDTDRESIYREREDAQQ